MAIVEIMASTRAMFTANPDTEDKAKWVPSKNGIYSVKSA